MSAPFLFLLAAFLLFGAIGMPIWGLQFQNLDSDAYQEDQVSARILELTAYLRTIQADAP